MNLWELAAKAKDAIARKLARGTGAMLQRPVRQVQILPTKPPAPPAPPPLPPLASPPVQYRPNPAADELLRLAHQAQTGQIKGKDAADMLRRIGQLVKGLTGSRDLTTDQRRAVDLISQVLDRWESREQARQRPPIEEEWPPEEVIEVFGRADIAMWPEELQPKEITRTPGSSNVYSFTWVPDDAYFEGAVQKQRGIAQSGTLIVTFKDWEPGMKDRPDQPGATYAYSNVGKEKWMAFKAATSPDHAGHAVWAYLRMEGTVSGHQHPYRLISVSGEYIPRRATAAGFARRMLPGARGTNIAWRRSTLEPGPLTRFGTPIPNELPQRAVGGRTQHEIRQWMQQERLKAAPNRGRPNTGRR